MGLFDIIGNLFGGGHGNGNQQAGSRAANRQDPYIVLLSRSIGKAHLHQKRFGQLVVKDQDWSIDLEKMQVQFGAQTYRISLLGTESKRDNSWMWAFANPTGYPEELVREARFVYRYCEEFGTRALARPQLALTPQINGHTIASIACASRNDGICYYRCPFNQNTSAFVLVHGLPAQIFVPNSAQEVMATFTTLTQQYPLDHQALVKGTFDENCIRTENRNGMLRGVFGNGEELFITFDGNRRIAAMNTQAPA